MHNSLKNIQSAQKLNPQPLEIQFITNDKVKRPPSPSPQQQQDKPPEEDDTISFCQLFRFADKYDYFMMLLGTIGGLALGAATPVFIYFWGQFTDVFSQPPDVIVDEAKLQLLNFVYLGVGTWVLGWLMITFWVITGQRQASTCRKIYFRSLLRQDIGWFDCIDQSSLSLNFSSDTLTFQGAIGQKIAMMLQSLGVFIGGFSVAFSQGWLMALVCLAGFPIIAFAGMVYMRSLQAKSKDFQKIYSNAGSQAQQACFSIKTVKQLNGEQYQHKKFTDLLESNKSANIKAGAKIAFGFALLSGSMFMLYSLGYWFGSHCVQGTSVCKQSISGGRYTPGTAITVFFSILVACFYLSQLSPALKKIGEGMEAATRIFKVLDRQPTITSPENGLKPDKCQGHIKLQNVSFSYPKDPSRNILNNISIQFDLDSTALVGQSGCGKSTILQLLMRFYDPSQGRILLDGNDLRDLDLSWLRNQFGYVGQQPVLFATSIRQNLLLGNEKATNEEIQQALQKAQAHQFVNQLEQKLETYVGSGGGQLSGGQKQRIAIARALLKHPKILLLDEATSALDRKNQKLIQATLNEISHGLRTITVAHRIKTVMNTDIVYVIDQGSIKEKGPFHTLQRYKNVPQEEEDEDVEKQISPNKGKEQTHMVPGELSKRKSSFAEKEQLKQKEKEDNKKLVQKYEKGIYYRIFAYLHNHKLSFIIGILLTLMNGLVYPVFSIFLSRIINALFQLALTNPTKVVSARTDANWASLAFLLLAIATLVFIFIRDLLTYIVGEQITTNIRKQSYQKMLRMPVFWFDRPDNNCGVLSTRLGTDCQTINGMATTYIYLVLQCLSTLIAAITIAFVFEWRTALVSIATMPIIVAAAAIRSKFRTGQMQEMDKAYKDSALIIMESLNNIRTVVSFGVQNTVQHKYQKYLDAPQPKIRCSAIVSGCFFGLAQTINFIAFGFMFFIGTVFMRDFGVELLDVFTVVYVILFAGLTIGNNSNFIPDINQAKLAASHIFNILDEEDQNQIQVRQESQMLKQGINGNIKLKNVSFKYESRQQYVFKNMNIQIQPGQKIAFVGPSGCGKSTIIQLLQRFYPPTQGQITIDGINIKDFDVHYLRSRFGVVSQEPVLFNTSFRQNIRYNKENTTEEEIRAAAAESNALSFIEGGEKLEGGLGEQQKEEKQGEGFDRSVGIKGSHISGGQKQRVAIARAILRDPQILLLDEATSALDAQNQKKVQDSLDRIMTRKTTLTVAHRLDTIKNSDQINVFQKGEIVESGTYSDLIARKGFFFNLERGTQFV